VYAEDLSRNGIYWNGNLMGAGNGGFLLSNGDVLQLSKNTELEFGCSDEQEDPLDLLQQIEAEVRLNAPHDHIYLQQRTETIPENLQNH
jgi:hypothetical protein